MVKWITFILAAIGLAAGIYTVATARQELPKPPPSRPPSVNPYPSGVACLGTVEPASREISVMAFEPGVVSKVFVRENERVEAGAPLFEVDPRPIESQMIDARAARDVAVAQVQRLKGSPRAEDVPPVEARLAEARSRLADARDSLQRTSDAEKSDSASENEVTRRRFAVEAAEAVVRGAEADLAKVRAGAWVEDLAVAQAQADQAEARLRSLEVMRERLTVRAPIAATVLKLNVQAGEFATSSAMAMNQAALVLGDLTRLNVRAQVDEEDAPLLRPGASAIARLRGGSGREVALKMVRIEPLALPKSNILGTPTERVDTRVIEVVFEVVAGAGGNGGMPEGMYPGQAVDVFIEVAGGTP